MKIDNDCFLAYYGKALLANIGNNPDDTVRFYLERATNLYPGTSAEDLGTARDVTPYACIDEALPGGTPLLSRMSRLNIPDAGRMLTDLGADGEHLKRYQEKVEREARSANRTKVAMVVVPIALIVLFFVLLFSSWVGTGFKVFLLVSGFIVLILTGAIGKSH